MIQIIAPKEPLREMLLLELQGKVAIPPALLEEERHKQGKHHVEERHKATDSSTGGKRSRQEDVSDVEVPFGRVALDEKNPSRCTLHVGAFVVDGSTGQQREPFLVLRRCDATSWHDRGMKKGVPFSHSNGEGSQCCLLQEWLAEHPEELTLDAVADGAPLPKRVYELVGFVERYVHLNSKPLRRYT
uniref:Uncharacterized protein n=1 Tax=Trypanosoma congolense (strain IL3000) TaxID=1068625 RepID=G0UQG5_TRYCI|nr:conserved hypothetical protein [Trypanosoma congolense IL3000]